MRDSAPPVRSSLTGNASPPAPPAAPDRVTRRARRALAAAFFLNAVFYANLVPRLPQVKADLGLSNASLGAALAALPLGALLAALSSAALIRRFGSGRVASYGLALLGLAIWTVAAAGSWAALAAALLVAGALDAIIDVAQNAHGLRVQRRYGRSILNGLHGLWSIGAVSGGLLGSAAAGLGIPLGVHLGAAALVFGAVALVASRSMLPGGEDDERDAEPDVGVDLPAPGALGTPALGLAALGVLAMCGAVVEDAGSSWSALYLDAELGAPPATAGLGFVALMAAMTVGRLTGDRVVDRFGQRRVARAGGLAVAAGLGLALAVPTVATTLAGLALAGLGVATLVPATYAAADELPGLRRGTGLALVNWLLRIGFLVAPLLVGVLADALSLRVALLVVVVAGLVTAVVGRVLRPRTAVSPPASSR